MRENTAYIRPPRALWVPFDLGRPLGVPNDAAFQLKVLRSVLALFERADDTVILEDFPDDAPGQGAPENMEGMVCPVPLKKQAGALPVDIVGNVVEEVDQLKPWAELFQTTNKRTSVGVSKMPLPDAIRFIGDVLTTGQSDQVIKENWAKTLRFATEDLRNYYLEAAAMRPGGAATTAERVNWFWGETSAGSLLLKLAPVCAKHEHLPLREVAIVPRAQEHRLP